jgi:drug/metabolite transporter (DMT)-like permease
VLGAAGGLSYAVTVVLGRSLAKGGFDAPTVLGLRFSLAAALLLVILVATRRPLLPARGERLAAFLLGAVGYAVESTLFFMGLERGSAAAVTLLFYAYPALVAGVELVQGRASPRVVPALGLSAVGTVLVVATGSRVSISTAGVVLALGAATSFAVYVLVSHSVIRRTDSLTTATWVALGAGLSFLLRGVIGSDLQDPDGRWWQVLANAGATAAAFTFMFAALRRLGPGPTAIVLTLEAAFAVVLAAVFLDETLRPVQLVGGALILVATVLVGLSRRTDVDLEVPS